MWNYDTFDKIFIGLWGLGAVLALLSGNILLLLIMLAAYPLLQVVMGRRHHS